MSYTFRWLLKDSRYQLIEFEMDCGSLGGVSSYLFHNGKGETYVFIEIRGTQIDVTGRIDKDFIDQLIAEQ